MTCVLQFGVIHALHIAELYIINRIPVVSSTNLWFSNVCTHTHTHTHTHTRSNSGEYYTPELDQMHARSTRCNMHTHPRQIHHCNISVSKMCTPTRHTHTSHTHAHTHTHIHTHIHVHCTHACTHTQPHTHAHTCTPHIHTHIHTHTHTHTHTHAHTHTRTHTHTTCHV